MDGETELTAALTLNCPYWLSFCSCGPQEMTVVVRVVVLKSRCGMETVVQSSDGVVERRRCGMEVVMQSGG